MKRFIKYWNKFLNRINPRRRERLLAEIMREDEKLGLYNITANKNLHAAADRYLMKMRPKSYWNYRVVSHPKDENWLQIKSVHYKDGEPRAVSVEPSTVEGYSIEDLKANLIKMLIALDKEILTDKDFDHESNT
jgi:hypothetical protein